MGKIIILDFGGQTTQLIARRIRELGVFCEIYPGDEEITEIVKEDLKGIILSGAPYSVYDRDAPIPHKTIFTLGVPVLGICYGLQLLTIHYGGSVLNLEHKEFGRARVSFLVDSPLFNEIPDGFFHG